MDGRRRIAQSLNWIAALKPRASSAHASATADATSERPLSRGRADVEWLSSIRNEDEASLSFARRWWSVIVRTRVPRGIGIAASALVILAGAGYGVVAGDHLPIVIEAFKQARDAAANAAGFRIDRLSLAGNHHISREEVLASAGITGTTSLLFLDVDDVRARLKSNPWIADASVLKLYPDELQIRIKERNAFALWQTDGHISVIADDGTVVEPFAAPQLLRLPFVVGAGAAQRAKEFLALLDRYPPIRAQVRASILIAERRWNLRLKNGLDVELPEVDAAAALDRLVALDREAKLLSRDIVSIDLRLPDRVTVRLSDRAAKERLDDRADKKNSAKRGRV